MGFVENHKETYINDFASVMEKCDEEYTHKEAIDIFKRYMYLSKNIKVDMRKKLYREIFFKAMKKAGYYFHNIPNNF